MEYYIPTAFGKAEYTEKRSRFIGQVWPAQTESEARSRIDEVKAIHHDARHNCWCISLHDGGLTRYSDDGEPQGTAGLPMLEIFQKNNICDAVCVVTRYFGGVLLGTGGLARAYTAAAKAAVEDAGLSAVKQWRRLKINCAYNLTERIKSALCARGATEERIAYGADVELFFLLSETGQKEAVESVMNLSSGSAVVEDLGAVLKAQPVEKSF